MKHGALIVIIAILLTAVMYFPAVQGSTLNVNIIGPTIVGTNQTVEYKITIEGYFTEYQYHLFLTGTNITGASPIGEITGKSNKTNTFYVNITFPQQPQTVYIMVMGIGTYMSNTTITALAKLKVKVITPIKLKATIYNPSSITIYNIAVKYYVDNTYLGTKIVPKIPANATINVTYLWVTTSLKNGLHTVKVVLNSSFIYFKNGQSNYIYQFYYGTPPSYEWVWYVFITVVVIIGMLIFLTRVGSKKTLPVPKWKRK